MKMKSLSTSSPIKDEFKDQQQLEYFTKMQESCSSIGIALYLGI